MVDNVRLDPIHDAKETEVLLTGMHQLLSAPRAVFLSTLDEEGWPDTRAMLNLRNPALYPHLESLFVGHGRDLMLLFTTNTSSVKYRQLQRDRRASVYVCLPDQFFGLRFQGEVEIVTDRDFRHRVWAPEWTMYYPGGPDSEDFGILRIFPRDAKYYHGLQVREIALPVPGGVG